MALLFLGGLVLLLVGTGLLVRRGARRYEAQHRSAGEWNGSGPLHPTKPKRWEEVTRTRLGLHLTDQDSGRPVDIDLPADHGDAAPGEPRPPPGASDATR
jgi:hypothetical protein